MTLSHAMRLVLFVILALFIGMIATLNHEESALAVGSAAPLASSVHSYDGKEWTLDRYKGRKMLVNFWAPWCPPCLGELGLLNRFAEAHAQDIIVLGLAVDSDPEEVARAVRDTGITFPIAAAPFETVKAFEAASLPHTVFIGADGKVLWKKTGALNERDLDTLQR